MRFFRLYLKSKILWQFQFLKKKHHDRSCLKHKINIKNSLGCPNYSQHPKWHPPKAKQMHTFFWFSKIPISSPCRNFHTVHCGECTRGCAALSQVFGLSSVLSRFWNDIAGMQLIADIPNRRQAGSKIHHYLSFFQIGSTTSPIYARSCDKAAMLHIWRELSGAGCNTKGPISFIEPEDKAILCEICHSPETQPSTKPWSPAGRWWPKTGLHHTGDSTQPVLLAPTRIFLCYMQFLFLCYCQVNH